MDEDQDRDRDRIENRERSYIEQLANRYNVVALLPFQSLFGICVISHNNIISFRTESRVEGADDSAYENQISQAKTIGMNGRY